MTGISEYFLLCFDSLSFPATTNATKNMKINSQGSLDSLCGIYSIVNAYKSTLRSPKGKLEKKLFSHLIFNFQKEGLLADAITDGVNRRNLKKIGKKSSKKFNFKLKQPIKRNKDIESLEAYWETLKSSLSDGTSSAVINYKDRKSCHWAVVTKVTPNQLLLADSDSDPKLKIEGQSQINMSSCTLSKKSEGKRFRIRAKDTFIISRQALET